MDTEAGMWSGLPCEILEQVLAFVPVFDLCRFRAVCKAWDRLITSPKFAARHKTASTSCVVMSCRRRILDRSWCILDVRDRRWYMVGYDEGYRLIHDLNTMAVDGGLVCQYLETKAQVNAVIVQKAIAKRARLVMPVAGDHVTCRWFAELNVMVDAASAAFKVVLINHSFMHWMTPELPVAVWSRIQNDPSLRVYESTTNEWRSMRNPPWINTRVGDTRNSIMFRGWLYVLWFGERKYHFWRYDATADVWERLGAPISKDFKYTDLVVSDQRLFLAAWYRRRSFIASDGCRMEREWFYRLVEVIVTFKFEDSEIGWRAAQRQVMARETVFEHSRAKMVALFEDDADHCMYKYYRISMFGFGSCLLFMSNTSGKAMTFDVATRTWDRNWPRNPLGGKLPTKDCSWVGEHMTLLLPSTP